VDLAALRRGAQDLLSLQRGSEANASGEQDTHERSDRATDLSDGASRVADSLSALSRRTPFITPQLQEELGQAIDRLARSGRELANGDRQQGEAHGREGSRALSGAVLELRKTESQMCKGGARPGGQSASQQMGELGDRQSEVNHETRDISRRLTEQLRLSTSDQEELRRLAEEQERIRRDLESLQNDEQRSAKLLGHLDAAQDEMKEVEETLRQGALDPSLEQKQQHILSRLLDAARSVNRRYFDPERESRPGEDLARSSPGDIPPDLLRQSDRLRMDLLKAEADRYPVQYRAFVEAYLRALNGSAQ
jgi:chromosome segregation ATPase